MVAKSFCGWLRLSDFVALAIGGIFDKQVSETCKACFFHICALRYIQASLTTEASKAIAAAIVGS